MEEFNPMNTYETIVLKQVLSTVLAEKEKRDKNIEAWIENEKVEGLFSLYGDIFFAGLDNEYYPEVRNLRANNFRLKNIPLSDEQIRNFPKGMLFDGTWFNDENSNQEKNVLLYTDNNYFISDLELPLYQALFSIEIEKLLKTLDIWESTHKLVITKVYIEKQDEYEMLFIDDFQAFDDNGKQITDIPYFKEEFDYEDYDSILGEIDEMLEHDLGLDLRLYERLIGEKYETQIGHVAVEVKERDIE